MKRPSLNGVYLHTAGEWRALNVSVMTQSTCKPHLMTDTASKRLTSPCTSWYFHITLAEWQQINRDNTGDSLEGEGFEEELWNLSLFTAVSQLSGRKTSHSEAKMRWFSIWQKRTCGSLGWDVRISLTGSGLSQFGVSEGKEETLWSRRLQRERTRCPKIWERRGENEKKRKMERHRKEKE